MKEIKYYCDICGEEVKNPKAETSCMYVNMFYGHDWEKQLPVSRAVYDMQLCNKCGDTLGNIIYAAKGDKSFKKIKYKGEE